MWHQPVQVEQEKTGEETWRNVQKYWKAEFDESALNHRKPLVDPKKRQ
jgi:hypothetical protein